jgi:hypothetical protein
VADGFFHTFSGWVVYIVAFLLLFAVGWLLDRFRPTKLSDEKEIDSSKESHPERVLHKTGNVVSVEGAE